MNSGRFKPPEVRKLNYCRLYLHAITLSDISDVTGDTLDYSMLQGKPSLQSSKCQWHHVHQERPSETEWKLWRRATLLWSRPNGQLITPLGRWLYPINKLRRRYFAYSHGRHLYVRQNTEEYFQAFIRMPGRSPLFRPRLTGDTVRRFKTLPVLALPVDILPSPEDDTLWMMRTAPCARVSISATVLSTPLTFHQFVETLSLWEVELLQHVQLLTDPEDLRTQMVDGFRVVSDGSVKHEYGNASFGWVLSSPRGRRLI